MQRPQNRKHIDNSTPGTGIPGPATILFSAGVGLIQFLQLGLYIFILNSVCPNIIEINCIYTIPEALRPYVKSVLSFRECVSGHLRHNMSFFADGYPGIMYIDSGTDIMLNDKKSPLFFFTDRP